MAYVGNMPFPPQTVVETSQYESRAAKRLTAVERDEALYLIASHPERGVVIPGTGGIRKIRFGIAGRGKSGGVRIIYFFYNERMPIYLLTVFAKNEKSDLSRKEQQSLSKLTKQLVAVHGGDR